MIPERTLPKNSEELALEKAINSGLIKTSSLEELKQVLRLVMVKIGLRGQNFPNELEKSVLFAHIIEHFGGNRLEEIKLAFDMAMSGKLDVDDWKCYENFSCAYFTMIMGSYQRWSSQAIAHLKPKEVPEQKIFTDQELEDSQREDCERQYQLFLKNIELRGTEINKSILEKDEILNPGESVLELFKRKRASGYLNIYVKSE